MTRDVQRTFLDGAEGQSYEKQFRFVLQTGLRTGELIGLKWEDEKLREIDLVADTLSLN